MSEFLSVVLIVIGIVFAMVSVEAYKSFKEDYECEMAISAAILGCILSICCFLASFYIGIR